MRSGGCSLCTFCTFFVRLEKNHSLSKNLFSGWLRLAGDGVYHCPIGSGNLPQLLA